MVRGPSRRSGRVTFPEVRDGRPSRRSGTGWGTIVEVQDGSRDPARGQGRVEGHEEVRDGSGDTPGGLRRVIRPTGRFGMGRDTHGEVRDGSGDRRGSQGRDVDLPRRLGELGDLEEIQDMSMDPPGGPGQVGKPS